MTSFLSSNITPAINGFFDWMNILSNKITIGGGQLYFYSTNNKTIASRNVLQATTGGKVLEWVDNAGVVTTLANTNNPTASRHFYCGIMAHGATQNIAIPSPNSAVVDPAQGGASQNNFGTLPNKSIEYVGENGVGYEINITGYVSIVGGAGMPQNITFTFANGAGVYADTNFNCVDNSLQVVPFKLTGFMVCNAGDIMGLIVGSANALTLSLSGLHVNITPI